ncbi:MAG: hypothetical protein KAG64_07635 [Bacteroidales bacterium]|nr:hypothetical protein [Bacteroidales bacterium]
MNVKRVAIQVVLLIAVVFLTFKIYSSIMEPVRFKSVIAQREDVIKQRLSYIKTLEIEYKKINSDYTSSFDTLIDFYNNGLMPLVLKHGSVPDTLTELQALEMGLITRDTTHIAIKDTLFIGLADFNINKIRFVPFTHNKKKFGLKSGYVMRANFKLPVFEVRCEMKDYLSDIEQQELLLNEINIIIDEEKFPGLILGSLEEPSTDGNW